VIVVDTSALMAVLLNEVEADRCFDVLSSEQDLAISAGSIAEFLIVATHRGIQSGASRLLEALRVEVVPLTVGRARLVALAHGKYGKGVHRAGLNMGDCYAYALAKELDASLLFVGNDFALTDVAAA
jgi:ribonuclease VapC